jgi:hypothetical protein
MMPHPERACEAFLGSTDGLVILQSMVKEAAHRAANAYALQDRA